MVLASSVVAVTDVLSFDAPARRPRGSKRQMFSPHCERPFEDSESSIHGGLFLGSCPSCGQSIAGTVSFAPPKCLEGGDCEVRLIAEPGARPKEVMRAVIALDLCCSLAVRLGVVSLLRRGEAVSIGRRSRGRAEELKQRLSAFPVRLET